MKIIQSPEIPKPNGHYSACIEHNGFLFISGQLPIDDTGNIPQSIADQTRLVLKKLQTILLAADSDVNHVLQVRIYLSDIHLWNEVNRIYADFFHKHKPTRCVVPSRELHYGCLIELEATACTIYT